MKTKRRMVKIMRMKSMIRLKRKRVTEMVNLRQMRVLLGPEVLMTTKMQTMLESKMNMRTASKMD